LAAVLAAAALCAQAAHAGPTANAPTIPDPAKLELPNLGAPTTAEDEADFDKYFYFHRADTSFEQALADIRECDGYARGLASPYGYQDTPYPYAGTMAGAVGGAIANALVAAIFGSAELRKARRVNMRRCMNYKGYDRYGLNKDVWQQFNFEEGLHHVDEDDRQLKLAKQAKAASILTPTGKVLGR
jgi:hypothetical protein